MAHMELTRSKTQTKNECHIFYILFTLLYFVLTNLSHVCLKLLLNSVINENYIILKLYLLHIIGVMLAIVLCFLNYFKETDFDYLQ